MSDKVRGTTFTKKASLLGGGREVQPVDLSVRWSSHLAPSPKESFQVPVILCFKIFWWGGTKWIMMCRLALGMECCVITSWTQQFDTHMERASWHMLKGAKCLSSLWLCSLCQGREITWFTMVGYRPFLLSDKISTSQLLPLLTAWFLGLSQIMSLTSPARPWQHWFTSELLTHTVSSMILLLLSNKPSMPFLYNRNWSPSAGSA